MSRALSELNMSIQMTVIVPVFKHWCNMPAFFEKMALQSYPPSQWQLLVVDNGSPSVPSQADLPDFVTLLSCTVPGSYAARNLGLQHAKGMLVIFTDADCLPDVNWLEAHWTAFQKNGVDTLNAGAVEVAKLSPGEANDCELYDSFLGIPQERYVTQRGYAVTANLAIPRTVFNTLGGFDEKRFSGGDAEFCQRAQRAGFHLCYVRDAVVFHPARSSWPELETKAKRVKGGQICNGPYLRRLAFFLKSFLYPILAATRVLRASMDKNEKKRILRVVVRLGLVEIKEVFFLLMGKKPERR